MSAVAYRMIYNEGEHGLIIVHRGTVGSPDFRRSFVDRFADSDRFASLRYTLTDYTAVQEYQVGTDDILHVTELATRFSPLNPGLIVVGVLPTDQMYGKARQWDGYGALTGWRTEPFRQREDADRFLREQLGVELQFERSLTAEQ